jgi:hypothetical protein
MGGTGHPEKGTHRPLLTQSPAVPTATATHTGAWDGEPDAKPANYAGKRGP